MASFTGIAFVALRTLALWLALSWTIPRMPGAISIALGPGIYAALLDVGISLACSVFAWVYAKPLAVFMTRPLKQQQDIPEVSISQAARLGVGLVGLYFMIQYASGFATSLYGMLPKADGGTHWVSYQTFVDQGLFGFPLGLICFLLAFRVSTFMRPIRKLAISRQDGAPIPPPQNKGQS